MVHSHIGREGRAHSSARGSNSVEQRTPSRRARGMRRRRWSAGAAVAAVVVSSLGAFVAPASAAISSAGPIDPASLFPSYYADANGLQLQLCQDGLPNCLAGPEQIQDVRAAGGDAEAFYFHASADLAGFTIETALEAAYAAAGDGQETTFQRRQAVAKGVTPGGKYTITDPYGSYVCTADASGLVKASGTCRNETNVVAGNFNAALGGPNGVIGPFLTWDTFGSTGAGAPPAGFIGDNSTPHAVVGSPTGFNKMRVSGPASWARARTPTARRSTTAGRSTGSSCRAKSSPAGRPRHSAPAPSTSVTRSPRLSRRRSPTPTLVPRPSPSIRS